MLTPVKEPEERRQCQALAMWTACGKEVSIYDDLVSEDIDF